VNIRSSDVKVTRNVSNVSLCIPDVLFHLPRRSWRSRETEEISSVSHGDANPRV